MQSSFERTVNKRGSVSKSLNAKPGTFAIMQNKLEANNLRSSRESSDVSYASRIRDSVSSRSYWRSKKTGTTKPTFLPELQETSHNEESADFFLTGVDVNINVPSEMRNTQLPRLQKKKSSSQQTSPNRLRPTQ